MDKITQVLDAQRRFSAWNLDVRLDALRALFDEIKASQPQICEALKQDLGKTEFESVATETSIVLEELSAMIRKLPLYASVRKVATSMLNFPAKGRICPEPLGNVLIFSAWNYPFQLAMMPLIGAVAAGNRVILKPAEQAEHTAKILEVIIRKVFKEEHVAVFNGGIDVAIRLLREKFDSIFYTGGTEGGKAVMRAAAEFLTPVTLELAPLLDPSFLRSGPRRLPRLPAHHQRTPFRPSPEADGTGNDPLRRKFRPRQPLHRTDRHRRHHLERPRHAGRDFRSDSPRSHIQQHQ